MTKTDRMFMIYEGTGYEGDFGRYGGTSWSNTPLTINKKIVWFNDEETVSELVKKLNEKAVSVFYRHDEEKVITEPQLDEFGYENFSDYPEPYGYPIEYEYREVFIPTAPVATLEIFDTIVEKSKDSWKDPSYDPEYDKYVDYITENDIDETSHSYSEWLTAQEKEDGETENNE